MDITPLWRMSSTTSASRLTPIINAPQTIPLRAFSGGHDTRTFRIAPNPLPMTAVAPPDRAVAAYAAVHARPANLSHRLRGGS